VVRIPSTTRDPPEREWSAQSTNERRTLDDATFGARADLAPFVVTPAVEASANHGAAVCGTAGKSVINEGRIDDSVGDRVCTSICESPVSRRGGPFIAHATACAHAGDAECERRNPGWKARTDGSVATMP
jgi:hypothetical protein